MKWETHLAVDIKFSEKLIEVVLEHAVDEARDVVDPKKSGSSMVSNRSFSAILAEVRSPTGRV